MLFWMNKVGVTFSLPLLVQKTNSSSLMAASQSRMERLR